MAIHANVYGVPLLLHQNLHLRPRHVGLAHQGFRIGGNLDIRHPQTVINVNVYLVLQQLQKHQLLHLQHLHQPRHVGLALRAKRTGLY